LDKKIVLEWSDADDDSSDSEDFEEELAIEPSVLNPIYEFSVSLKIFMVQDVGIIPM
jgi:hypothetical protein